MRLRRIPKIIAAATEVMVTAGLVASSSGAPNLKVKPPIPATKIAEATKIFFG